MIGRIGAAILVLLTVPGIAAGPNPAQPPGCGLSPEHIGRFVSIPDGNFVKSEPRRYPEELTGFSVSVAPFEMLSHEVTNDEFAAFVGATGYVTDAEQGAARNAVGAGSAVFRMPGNAGDAGRWQLIAGATWSAPEGPGSDLSGRGGHPVVHVSLRDARAYAAWAGGRLPTEVEWEYAAMLGLPDPARADSGARDDAGRPVANTWQGPFPRSNTSEDGFEGTAPVGCFPPDRIGLHDMIGNVWEWTGTAFGPGTYVIKGGSHLCAENACQRYRPGARQPQEADFSTSHIGFRIVREPRSG